MREAVSGSLSGIASSWASSVTGKKGRTAANVGRHTGIGAYAGLWGDSRAVEKGNSSACMIRIASLERMAEPVTSDEPVGLVVEVCTIRSCPITRRDFPVEPGFRRKRSAGLARSSQVEG